jgi:catechol 2,3-dioxygenase-like lactoylglutathione lyase family enzyme
MGWLDKIVGKGEMIKGLDHVAIVVSDMDRAIEFYTEVLGLRLISDGRPKGGEKKSFLGTKSKAIVALSEDRNRAMQKGEYLAGVNHVAFGVDDAEKSSRILKERGIQFVEIKVGEDGKPNAYHFLDPDGLELEICSDTGEEVPQY